MFSQYLANNHTSTSSVKNYIAGAKNWVLLHNGSIFAFISHEISMMNKSLAKKDVHTVKRALPLSWDDIQTICIFLDSANNVPLAVKPCILIGFTCFLRGSNLVPTHGSWPGPHTLLARNLIQVPQGLTVVIPSTKSKTQPYAVNIPRLPSPQFCPVVAWDNYYRVIKPKDSGPAFIMTDRSPLSTKLIVALMRAAIGSDPSRPPSSISMHSLRRGAAQDAAKSGLSTKQIMNRGGWATKSGLAPYLLE